MSATTPLQRVTAIEAAFNAYMEAVDLNGDHLSRAIWDLVVKARAEQEEAFQQRVHDSLTTAHANGLHTEVLMEECPTCQDTLDAYEDSRFDRLYWAGRP